MPNTKPFCVAVTLVVAPSDDVTLMSAERPSREVFSCATTVTVLPLTEQLIHGLLVVAVIVPFEFMTMFPVPPFASKKTSVLLISSGTTGVYVASSSPQDVNEITPASKTIKLSIFLIFFISVCRYLNDYSSNGQYTSSATNLMTLAGVSLSVSIMYDGFLTLSVVSVKVLEEL